MTERIQWIIHQGKKILFVDQSDLRDEESSLRLLDEMEAAVYTQPKGQVILTLFHSHNSLVTKAITDRSKQMVANMEANGYKSGPSVIVGASGFQKAIIQTMQFFIKNIHIADSIDEGKDWLVAQTIK